MDPVTLGIIGAGAAVGGLGTSVGSTVYGINEQEQAKQRAADQQKNVEAQQKRAQEAAKITGNILSQDYITNVLAPTLGVGQQAKLQNKLTPTTGGQERTVAPVNLDRYRQPALTPAMTPGVVKKPRGY